MGKGASSKSEAKTTVDPASMALATGNFNRAQSLADKPFTPYTGQRVAAPTPFTANQQAYTDALGGIVKDNVGGLALDGAETAASSVAGYQPTNVSAQSVSGSPISAQMLRDTDLDPYMNKFLGGVLDTSMADIEYQRAVQEQRNKSAATSAGAWGGDGEAVLRNLDNDSYARAKASTASGLRSQAFTNAQDAATGDITRRLGVDQFNSGQAFDASKFNSSQALNAALGNQSAAAQAAQLRLSGAGALSDVSQRQLDQAGQRAGYLGAIGNVDAVRNAEAKDAQQAGFDADYEQYLREQQYGPEMQSLLNQSLGGVPMPTSTSTTNTQNPGTLATIGGLVKTGANIASMFSDKRLKTDVKKLGETDDGVEVASYRMKSDPKGKKRIGVIAQQVAKVKPGAVHRDKASGFLKVDYNAALGGSR